VHSRRAVPTRRSAYEFARGACGGVLITSVPASAWTASNAPVYLASRSRISNRNDWPALQVRHEVAGALRHPRPRLGAGRDALRPGEYAEKFSGPQNAGQGGRLRTQDSPAEDVTKTVAARRRPPTSPPGIGTSERLAYWAAAGLPWPGRDARR
jgi:hypothetical protein